MSRKRKKPSAHSHLPAPPVPAHVDIRGAAFPLATAAAHFAQVYGVPVAEVESHIRAVAGRMGMPLEEVGHG